MAIAYDNSGYLGNTIGSPVTYSFTVGAISNPVLYVWIANTKNGDNVTGVTYNGVSMTRVGYRAFVTAIGSTYVYELVGCATGANNIVITETDTAQRSYVSAISYAGVDQTTPSSNVTGFSDTSVSSTSHSITAGTNNTVMLLGVNSNTTVSTGTGSTSRMAWNAVSGHFIYDSGGAVTGSYTMAASDASGNWGEFMLSLAPAPTFTATPLMHMMASAGGLM